MTSIETSFWHPFADMATVKDHELVIDRAEGVWVWDEEGNRYLDAAASLWYANAGHCRPEIIEAVRAQMTKLDAFSAFAEYANRPAIELAERLAALAPVEGAKVFFTSGGGDSVDTAMKLCRLYWDSVGQPARHWIAARDDAYHGTHGVGTSLVGIPVNRSGFGPLVEDVMRIPRGGLEAVREAFDAVGPENVGAVITEPVIGAGGVHPPEPGYLEGLQEICHETGALFIVDSVICGFGRLGDWFGTERWDLRPDMITFAKGVTGGHMPLGGVVVAERVARPFWHEGPGRAFRHGQTYSGHPTSCAAGLATLDLFEADGLLDRGAALEGDLMAALAPLADSPVVAELRGGTGALAALEIAPEFRDAPGSGSAALTAAVRDHGVLVRPLQSAIAFSPPLTIGAAELRLMVDAVRAGLDDYAERFAPNAATTR